MDLTWRENHLSFQGRKEEESKRKNKTEGKKTHPIILSQKYACALCCLSQGGKTSGKFELLKAGIVPDTIMQIKEEVGLSS